MNDKKVVIVSSFSCFLSKQLAIRPYRCGSESTRVHSKKKVREFPVPSRDVTTKLSLGGNNDVINELFLRRGSLVSDIPAGDGKLVNLFLQCRSGGVKQMLLSFHPLGQQCNDDIQIASNIYGLFTAINDKLDVLVVLQLFQNYKFTNTKT
jgi:hypothetical protein